MRYLLYLKIVQIFQVKYRYVKDIDTVKSERKCYKRPTRVITKNFISPTQRPRTRLHFFILQVWKDQGNISCSNFGVRARVYVCPLTGVCFKSISLANSIYGSVNVTSHWN